MMKHKWLRTLLIVLGVLVGGAAFLRWQLWGLKTTETQVPVPGIPRGFDGMRLVHLSDLHGHEYGAGNRELLRRIRAEHPEVIVVTGDVIDQASQLEMLPALASGLSAIAPTYYVTGNHEWASGTAQEVKQLFRDHGVKVLDNRYVELERDGSTLLLAGVDDPNGYADQKSPGELHEEMMEDHPGAYSILLAHRNNLFDRYAACGYNLVLAGHAHGGMIRLPFTDGLLGNGLSWFPTWTAGVYTLGDSTLFVSRGLGNNTTPLPGIRVFNRPEVAVVELVKA